MEYSKPVVRCIFSAPYELGFSDQQLTSLAGLIAFQHLFFDLDFGSYIGRCIKHPAVRPIVSLPSYSILLIAKLSSQRNAQYFQNDPLSFRTLGIHRMLTQSTLSCQSHALIEITQNGNGGV